MAKKKGMQEPLPVEAASEDFLDRQKPLPLKQAAEYCARTHGTRPDTSTIYRWAVRGLRNVRIEYRRLGREFWFRLPRSTSSWMS